MILGIGLGLDFTQASGTAVIPGVLTATRGVFTETGVAANLLIGHDLPAALGAFTLTGVDAGLNKAGDFVLPAGTGAFTETGDAMTPTVGYLLPSDLGVIALTGQPAFLDEGHALTAAAGSFALTGIASTGTESSAWTPLSLGAALIGWYKADAGNAQSGVITSWSDQSPNNYTAAPNGFTGPTYNATGLGGKPSMDFAGGNATGMRTTADTVAIGTGNAASIFMLAEVTAGSTSGAAIAGNGSVSQPAATANSFAVTLSAAGPNIQSDQNFGSYGTEAFTLNTEARFGFIWDGTNGTPYLNNVAGTPAAHSFNFTSPGSLWIANGGFSGSIREIIFTNTALSGPDRASLDFYLASRV